MILIIEVWERFWYFVLAGQYGAWHPKKDNNLWVFLVGNAEFSSKEKKVDAYIAISALNPGKNYDLGLGSI
jgi:hypothetical protein